jgi:hypothetical protein
MNIFATDLTSFITAITNEEHFLVSGRIVAPNSTVILLNYFDMQKLSTMIITRMTDSFVTEKGKKILVNWSVEQDTVTQKVTWYTHIFVQLKDGTFYNMTFNSVALLQQINPMGMKAFYAYKLR